MKKVTGFLMAIAIMTAMAGCDTKKDDSNNSLLMLYLMDEMSGNCATITKYSASYYSARGSKIPKSQCASLVQYFTSSSAAKAELDAEINALIAAMPSTNCSTPTSSLTNTKNSTTAASMESSANTASNKCASYNISIKPIVYCISQSYVDAYKSNLSNTTRYHLVSDVAADMAVSLLDSKTFITNNQTTYGFTSAAINAITPIDSSYWSMYYTPAGNAFMIFFSYPNCAKDILTANPAVKAQVARGSGINTSLGITTADANAVTSVVAGYTYCGYGSSFTATSSTGTCPSTYPTW